MSDAEPHLLVVDDDPRLRELLRRYLSEDGFRGTVAAEASEARANLASFAFELIVLDVMMPGDSGLDLTRELRRDDRSPPLPILLLTAMGEAEDRINGLEQGADDYLAKPFEPRELVLRIRNIIERRGAADEVVRTLRFGGFRFDLARGELFRAGEIVRLTAAEAGLLSSLAARGGEAVSRRGLSGTGQFRGNIPHVGVQINPLRPQIEPDPRHPRSLQTP